MRGEPSSFGSAKTVPCSRASHAERHQLQIRAFNLAWLSLPLRPSAALSVRTVSYFSVDGPAKWLHFCATMKTATVRDLRNRYTSVLRWVSAGEDVLITQRGKVIARLSPETAQTAQVVDWASSPEVLRDRSKDHVLSAEQSAEILAEAGGRW